MEGAVKVVSELLKRSLKSTAISAIGGLLAKRALEGMKRRMDWREIGGAPLVGVNGVGFISHGRSDAVAIESAIRRVRDAAKSHFVDEIAAAVAPTQALVEAARAEAAEHAARHAAPQEA
jgi:glycerol-3-phosphate acyltransferase PlsX